MKQEPVAWADEYNILMEVTDFEFQFPAFSIKPKEDGDWIPLYTAPRELSDEEILNIAELFWECDAFNEVSFDDIGFARAILKKASEK